MLRLCTFFTKFAALKYCFRTTMMKKIKIFLLAVLCPIVANAAVAGGTTHVAGDASDSVCVSFLTCSPGEEIHRLYGHTALRIQDDGEDWAVNFGWFSFNTPNFVIKFILGLTDYSMAYQTMPIFIMDMAHDNMNVTEQVLNLTNEEAADVKKAMRDILESKDYTRHDYNFSAQGEAENTQSILAANWTYRYNFLYDNCTTRAVDAIKDALKAHGESLVFTGMDSENMETTQRDMIHEFTHFSPWYEFGQDLLLGPEVDKTHSYKELTEGLNFLPTYAQNFFDGAQIKDKSGKTRPLVAQSICLTPFLSAPNRHPAFPLPPIAVTGIIYAAAVIITAFERRANLAAKRNNAVQASKAWKIWGNSFDFTCWTLQGLVGVLLVIMVGWSEHPAVGTNWLLLIFNPLFFLGIPARLVGGKFEAIFKWFATLMAIGIMIVAITHVQTIPIAILPIALTIATRAKLGK